MAARILRGTRLIALLEIAFIIILAMKVQFSGAAVCALLLLALHRRPVLRQMFSVRGSWRSRLRLAVAVAAVVWAGVLLVVSLLSAAGLPRPDYSLLADWLESDSTALLLALVWVWTTVAFGEEILARGFLIDRLETLFRGLQGAVWLAVGVAAILFGLAHRDQGPGGMVLTGMIGLLLGWLYVHQQRNLWTNVLVHGLVDTVAVVLLFFGVSFA